jgi:hypothetical protein
MLQGKHIAYNYTIFIISYGSPTSATAKKNPTTPEKC